jgi:hypothetical protein
VLPEAAHEAPSGRVERLVAYVTDGALDDSLSADLVAWAAGSGAFRTFAQTHRDKIRKKLRGARTPDARLDVRTELAVARSLLADRRFVLEFEAGGAAAGGPDFAVGFRGHRAFNLEVTRRRGPAPTTHGGFLLAKLRQLPAGHANAILLAVEGDASAMQDVAALVREWRARSDAEDDDFFRSRGLAGARDFRMRFARLGGVFVMTDAPKSGRAALWTNPNARHALPTSAARAALAALRTPRP